VRLAEAGASLVMREEKGKNRMLDKKLLLAASLGLATVAFTAAPVFAEEQEDEDLIPGEITGSVALTSDYSFRGISQTDKGPALQGSLEYAIDTGIAGTTAYAGFWGSNVDFNDGDEANLEIDVLFGLRGSIGDTGLGWNLGGAYYSYPGANKANGEHLNYDYWEIVTGLTYEVNDIVALSGSYFYAPDFFGATGKAHYFNGGVTVTPPIDIKPFGLSFYGNVGRQLIEDAQDYTDWTIGAALSYKFLKFTLAYVDTDITQADLGGNRLANGRVIATLSATF